MDGETGWLDGTMLDADPLGFCASLTCWFGFITLEEIVESANEKEAVEQRGAYLDATNLAGLATRTGHGFEPSLDRNMLLVVVWLGYTSYACSWNEIRGVVGLRQFR